MENLLLSDTLFAPKLEPGTVIAGKYRLDRVLGSGGMGVVVKATHLALDEPVAIKLLHGDVQAIPGIGARFLREARAAARLKSIHAARSHDIGTLEDQTRYLVMEYLEGMDLATALEEQGPMPVEAAVGYLLQACDAIAEAHALGIIHRDLKPANLFRVTQADGSPLIKVLDFGISKLADSPSSRTNVALTTGQVMMGTPHYASPEQMTSAADVDARTDIWALGVVLFEFLTGSHPFEGVTAQEIISRVIAAQPRAIQQLRPDLSPALTQVITLCLEKDRERRFPTVADLVQGLAWATSSELDAASRALAGRILRRYGGGRSLLEPPPILLHRGSLSQIPERRDDLTTAPAVDSALIPSTEGIIAATRTVPRASRSGVPPVALGVLLVLGLAAGSAAVGVRHWVSRQEAPTSSGAGAPTESGGPLRAGPAALPPLVPRAPDAGAAPSLQVDPPPQPREGSLGGPAPTPPRVLARPEPRSLHASAGRRGPAPDRAPTSAVRPASTASPAHPAEPEGSSAPSPPPDPFRGRL